MIFLEDLVPRPHPVSDLIDKRLSPILDLENGPWVAGGAARRLAFPDARIGGDIDVFVSSKDQFDAVCGHIRKSYKGTPLHHTNRARTETFYGEGDRCQIQVIKGMAFPSYELLLADFDFSVCRFVTDGTRVLYTPEAYQHCLEKRLVMDGDVGNRSGGMARLGKYAAEGFTPDPGVVMRYLVPKREDGLLCTTDFLTVFDPYA